MHLNIGCSARRQGLFQEADRNDQPVSGDETNNMIAATKHKIFEMMFSASSSGSVGKANLSAAQTANTTNIPATA